VIGQLHLCVFNVMYLLQQILIGDKIDFAETSASISLWTFFVQTKTSVKIIFTLFYFILCHFILFSTAVQYCKWCYTNVIL